MKKNDLGHFSTGFDIFPQIFHIGTRMVKALFYKGFSNFSRFQQALLLLLDIYISVIFIKRKKSQTFE